MDDFSNGNFTEDPPWQGDHDRFIVQDGLLRLWDEEAGSAWLATESALVENTQWDFWIRLAFTPSDNNHARIYLVSDQVPLGDGPLNAYFIQVGRTGGDNKRLFFCRQDGEAVTTLLTGSMNLAEGTNNILRIRVIRDGPGHWAFYADPAGGHLFVPQGEVFDDTHTTTAWFGILCNYTVSNARRFYFDDFRVGDILPEDPPEINRLRVLSPSSLELQFNRVLNISSAESIVNYLVDQGVGHPIVAQRQADTPHVVRLFFDAQFKENHVYTLSVSGVSSTDGQVMEAYEGPFVHYVSNPFDVVFNEVMANSRPVVELPPHDWVELYNTTHMPIPMEGWTLSYGSTSREIPEVVIPPEGYLLLCNEAACPELAPYGEVVTVPGLSATAFTIGGTQLVLRDDQGEMISFVSYTDRWYRDATKAAGGWSLEKIDPYNFCQGAENWTASVNPQGGTPGGTNSVRAPMPNVSRPRITRAGWVDSHTVRLHFSEPMREEALEDPASYFIDRGIGEPIQAHGVRHDWMAVELVLADSLERGKIYSLRAGADLTDCDLNPLLTNRQRLARPEAVTEGEVLINEVLFNPPPGGARYVELFSHSEKVFDLHQMVLASVDTLAGQLTTVRQISGESHLLFPGEYLVLTNDTAAVKNTYHTRAMDHFAELSAMPRMTNADGIVVLATRGHDIIDRLVYTEEMHLPLLADRRGVSLERVHPARPSHKASSWHSAAAAAGFGTPGYRNSQFSPPLPLPGSDFFLEPRVFSPDGSGVDDLQHICYELEEPGFVAHVRVFDARGRLVRTVAEASLLSTSGCLTWDGTTDSRERASTGMYVVHVTLFNQHGQVRHFRMASVVAGRL